MKKIILIASVAAVAMFSSCSSEKKAEDLGAQLKEKIENCTNPDSLKLYVQQAQDYAAQLLKEGKAEEAQAYLDEVQPAVAAKDPSLIDMLKAQADSAATDIKAQADSMAAKAAEKVGDVKDAAVDKANQVKDAAVDKANQAKDAAVDKANQVKDAAVDKANQAKEAAVDKANQAKEAASNAINSVLK